MMHQKWRGSIRLHIIYLIKKYYFSLPDCLLNMFLLFQWIPQDTLSASISHASYSCNSQLVFAAFTDGNIGVFDAENLRLRCRIAPSVINRYPPCTLDTYYLAIDRMRIWMGQCIFCSLVSIWGVMPMQILNFNHYIIVCASLLI